MMNEKFAKHPSLTLEVSLTIVLPISPDVFLSKYLIGKLSIFEDKSFFNAVAIFVSI